MPRLPENSYLGTRSLNHFQIFRNIPGRGRGISGKITVWYNRYTIQIFKNPWRTPGHSKKFIQPTEGNCIPGQEKFDHWHPGWGPEQPVQFCISVYLCTVAPLLYLLSDLLPPPPLPNVQYSICRQCVTVGGGGCWNALWAIFGRSFTLCFWPDSDSTKLLHHPKH